jgi:hypothetical protein
MTSEERARVLVAVTETSPVAELWRAVLSRHGTATEVVALFIPDDRWQRAASLPFTREVSKLGGTMADFTRQRADELNRQSVLGMHRRIKALAAEADLTFAFVELSQRNDKRLEELAAHAETVLIAPALITRDPIYRRISRLRCQIELIGRPEVSDE